MLVVQDFAYGKYLGKLKVDFDADGEVTKWSGNPILLTTQYKKIQPSLQQVQQMKIEVSKVSEVRNKFHSLILSFPEPALPVLVLLFYYYYYYYFRVRV